MHSEDFGDFTERSFGEICAALYRIIVRVILEGNVFGQYYLLCTIVPFQEGSNPLEMNIQHCV